MGKLNFNYEEYKEWLTPERLDSFFLKAGFEIELKDEYQSTYSRVEVEHMPSHALNSSEHDNFLEKHVSKSFEFKFSFEDQKENKDLKVKFIPPNEKLLLELKGVA